MKINFARTVALCLEEVSKFLKFYTFATKHKVNVQMNDELSPTTVYHFEVASKCLMSRD